MDQPIIVGSILVYAAILFAIAFWSDRRNKPAAEGSDGAIAYGLSIAVYCTSWTFFGAVGTAETRGLEYLPIYLGPFIIFSVGRPLLSRLVETGKSMHTTSIADFISARYGKSRSLAALVTLIAVIGALPYIALQLKSVATTFDYLASDGSAEAVAPTAGGEGIFLVAIILALFAILFGTRHIDITRHNRGMITAIAFDSIIKLVALIAVGVFAVGLSASGLLGARPAPAVLETPIAIDRFITLTLISTAAILCLPRQFHVAVVECQSPKWIGRGANLFLVYLLAISALVVPIAQAGAASQNLAGVAADLTVLALPLSAGADALALFVFVGGFAAATGMVIVASVALSTMIANDLVAPVLDWPRRPSWVSTSVGAPTKYNWRSDYCGDIRGLRSPRRAIGEFRHLVVRRRGAVRACADRRALLARRAPRRRARRHGGGLLYMDPGAFRALLSRPRRVPRRFAALRARLHRLGHPHARGRRQPWD